MANWSKIIEAHGVRIRLFERNGMIYRDVTLGRTTSERGKPRTGHDVKSLGTRDRSRAEQLAEALAEKIAETRFTGASSSEAVTLGQLFTLYREQRLPALATQYGRHAKTRMRLFETAWGRPTRVADIGQGQIDRYCRLRRSGELSPFEPEDAEDRKGRKPRKVRDGTLAGDFRWLSSVFNWARGYRIRGQRVLHENPLHDVKWPKERNPRQPVASERRYTVTQEHTDSVDERGQ